jgi:NAD(P)-dependent dehydrogenase (short-subunit alcohol dehydrogenase family)
MATGEDRRVALVTGAAQGLGFGLASAFAAEGYDIAIVDLDEAMVQAAAAKLRERGVRALGMRGDVSHRGDVDAFVARVVDELGRLDVLVNNAQTTRMKAVLDTTDEDLELTWRSGFAGSLYCMQAAFPHLRATKGCVINLASGAGLSAPRGYAVYAATKEAIRTLTRIAALEWGEHGVRVNVISPGAQTAALDRWAAERPEEYRARTAQIPLGRFGDPEADIGKAVVFLASPAASYITGNTLVVDGGAHYLG